MLGRNIPTQAIIELIHGFRKACSSLCGWCSLELESGGVTSGDVQYACTLMSQAFSLLSAKRALFTDNIRKASLLRYGACIGVAKALFCLKSCINTVCVKNIFYILFVARVHRT